MVVGTSETRILSGILDFLLICDTTNTATCGYTFRTRANFVNDKLQMYTYHWPLVANYTVFDQKQTKSYEFLLKNYSSTDLLFYNDDNTRPVFPTDNGWMSFQWDALIRTEAFPFNSMHQFTIEFEVFLVTNEGVLDLYPHTEDATDWKQYWMRFGRGWTKMRGKSREVRGKGLTRYRNFLELS